MPIVHQISLSEKDRDSVVKKIIDLIDCGIIHKHQWELEFNDIETEVLKNSLSRVLCVVCDFDQAVVHKLKTVEWKKPRFP